ncbi:hypothetical protein N7505_007669, partial [Penicillium chrysogenum]
STVKYITENTGFRKRGLGKLSEYTHERPIFSRSRLSICRKEAEGILNRRKFPDDGETNPNAESILNDSGSGPVDPIGCFPHYKSCSIAAFLNIRFPCQRPSESCTMTSRSASLPVVLLRPYIRRLIVTAQVSLDVMRIFFLAGIGRPV